MATTITIAAILVIGIYLMLYRLYKQGKSNVPDSSSIVIHNPHPDKVAATYKQHYYKQMYDPDVCYRVVITIEKVGEA
jgi:hypothetical protein